METPVSRSHLGRSFFGARFRAPFLYAGVLNAGRVHGLYMSRVTEEYGLPTKI